MKRRFYRQLPFEIHRSLEKSEKLALLMMDMDGLKKVNDAHGHSMGAFVISQVGRIIGATNLVKEFERTIFKELDMHIEAGSIEKFATCFKDSDEIYIPRVHWEYTTKSVLVMEHIDGRILWDPSLPGLAPAERAAVYDEMNRVIAALHSVKFDGAVISDHLPTMVGGRRAAEAYHIGYMRGLIHAVQGQ